MIAGAVFIVAGQQHAASRHSPRSFSRTLRRCQPRVGLQTEVAREQQHEQDDQQDPAQADAGPSVGSAPIPDTAAEGQDDEDDEQDQQEHGTILSPVRPQVKGIG